jgi:hypothetical protein
MDGQSTDEVGASSTVKCSDLGRVQDSSATIGSQPEGTANTVNRPEALSLTSSLRPWPPPSSGDAAAPSVSSPASALPATPRSLKQLRSRFEIKANQTLDPEADRVSQRAKSKSAI